MADLFRSEPPEGWKAPESRPRSILGAYAGRIGRQRITQDMIGEGVPVETQETPSEKGWLQSLKEGAVTGIERAGAGLSGVLGRSPEVIGGDLADIRQYAPSTEEEAFDAETQRRAQAFDDAQGFRDSASAALDILGLMVQNPKLAAKKVSESLGSSLPAFGGAAAGAVAGTAMGGPIGTVIGGLIGYIGGNLATNVQAEMAGKLEADLAERGVDTRDAAKVAEAIRAEPGLIDSARVYAAKKGAGTTAAETAVDVATLGAGKFLKPARTLLGKATHAGGIMVGQGISEGAGSAAGSVAVGEPVSVGQAITEGAYGAVAGAPEGAAIFHGGRRLANRTPEEKGAMPAEDEVGDAGGPSEPISVGGRPAPTDWEVVDDLPQAAPGSRPGPEFGGWDRQLGREQAPPPGPGAADPRLESPPGGGAALPMTDLTPGETMIAGPAGVRRSSSTEDRLAEERRADDEALGITPDVRAAQAARGAAPVAQAPTMLPFSAPTAGDVMISGPQGVRQSTFAEDQAAAAQRQQAEEMGLTADVRQAQLARSVQPADIMSRFGAPFILRSSAEAEARRAGGRVVEVNDGFVVRPEQGNAGSGRDGASVVSAVGAAVLQRPAGVPGGEDVPALSGRGAGAIDVPDVGADGVPGAAVRGDGAAPDAGGVRPRGGAAAVTPRPAGRTREQATTARGQMELAPAPDTDSGSAGAPAKPTFIQRAEAALTKKRPEGKQDAARMARDSVSKGKIGDVGERLVGARKDLSNKTGPRASKQADERPGWRRRYEVSQIASSRKPDEVGRWVIRDQRQKDRLGQPKQAGDRTFSTKEDAEAAIQLVEVTRNRRATPTSAQKGEPTVYEIQTSETDKGAMLFSRRRISLPDAVIGATLGEAARHRDYAAAKAGDPTAAARLVRDLVTDEFVEKVRKAIGGRKPIVQPVLSVEESGRNKIPLALAEALASRLGLESGHEIVQSTVVRRTLLGGLARLLSSPEFDGEVQRGTDYLLVDDTLTQGGTFAALAGFVEDGGGRVIGTVALTGKQYSAKLALSDTLLEQVRAKFGDIEEAFRAATGHGFDALTESEARYLVKHDSPDAIRDRFLAARKQGSGESDPLRSGRLGHADIAAHAAATSPFNDHPEPTEAQKDAGNYPKGHLRVAGLDISIENPAGTHRRPEWPAMPAHYGYILGTVGRDGDHVDVFLREGTPEDFDGPVFVIDQNKAGGGFDEHKVMLGWRTQYGAARAYRAAFSRGWKGLGTITRTSMDAFKAWLAGGRTKEPFAAGARKDANGTILQAHRDAVERLQAAIRRAGFEADQLHAAAVPDALAHAVGALKRLFGVDVVFVGGAERLSNRFQFDGIYLGDKTLYVSTTATKPFRQVVGHEFLHHLKKTIPALYEEFAERVRPHLLARRAQAYADQRATEYPDLPESLRAETGWEETFADAWGDAWHDPGFWQSLVAQDRGLFRRIAAKWKLFVMRIRMALGIDRDQPLVKDLFTDFDAVRDIIADITGRARADQKAIPAVADRSGADDGTRFSRRAATAPLPVTDPKVGPIDTLLRAAGGKLLADKLLSPMWDRLIRAVGRVTPEAVKQGLVSDYGLDEPYMDVRAGTRSAINKQLRAAKSIIDMLAGLDREQSRIAYQWMTERPDTAAERAMMAALPEESRAVMRRMKEMVHELGKAAVRAGLLSAEAFERNEYAYLHRSYKSHEADSAGADGAHWKARAKIRAETFKGRGLRHDVDQERLLRYAGEVRAGDKFTRFERRRADGRLAEVRYVPADKPMPAELRGWASDGVWEARWMGKPNASKVGMYRDFTRDERARMGEIEEVRYAFAKTVIHAVQDIEHAKFLQWVANEYSQDPRALEAVGHVMHDGTAGYINLRTYAPEEWVKVPATKVPGTTLSAYGALAGRAVPAAVWNDIRSQFGSRPETAPGKLYDWILRAWKVSKTALSPAVHTNNIMANVIMADLADIRATDVLEAFRVLRAAKKGDATAKALVARYEDSGAEQGSLVAQELRLDAIEPMLAELAEETDRDLALIKVSQLLSMAAHGDVAAALQGLKSKKAVKTATLPFKMLLNAYRAEDSVFRLAAFIRHTSDGMSDLQAGQVARDAFLNYDINAPWIAALRRGPLPFIAFSYRAIPMLMKAAVQKPWKIAKYAAIAAALNSAAYMLLGLGADDERRERALLPEEKSGKIFGIFPRLMRMPWNDEHGSPVFLDVRRWLPAGDVFDVQQSQAAVPLPGWLTASGPLGLLMEFMLNKSSFTGQPIVLETDTGGEAMAKIMDHLFKFMTPNVPVPSPFGWLAPTSLNVPGLWQTYAWTSIESAGSGVTDAFGRERSLPQAAAAAVGVKLGAYPQDVARAQEGIRFRQSRDEINKQVRSINRQESRGALDAEEAQAKRETQREKLRRISERLREKMDAAR